MRCCSSPLSALPEVRLVSSALSSVLSLDPRQHHKHLARCGRIVGHRLGHIHGNSLRASSASRGPALSVGKIAGAAALVLQSKGKAAASDVRTILQTTAKPVPVSKAPNALPQTLAQQGAGLVDVFNALNSQTEVSPGELLLNDTAHWKSVSVLRLQRVLKINCSHVFAQTHGRGEKYRENDAEIRPVAPASRHDRDDPRGAHTS